MKEAARQAGAPGGRVLPAGSARVGAVHDDEDGGVGRRGRGRQEGGEHQARQRHATLGLTDFRQKPQMGNLLQITAKIENRLGGKR